MGVYHHLRDGGQGERRVTRIEVDQSIKIGDTHAPTVLALSNDVEQSLLIPATVKRACVRTLRGRWESSTVMYIRLFAAVLFLLLREHLERASRVIIDAEYPGHERDIKDDLLRFCRRAGLTVDPAIIHFAPVGKHSPAHHIALETLRGKRPPDQVATVEELLRIVG
jgi:hypothetical protein